MNTSPRYAIYLAPDVSTPLWQFGSAILGYDAATGQDVPHPIIEGVSADILPLLTRTARQYGFHATLKAPIRLREGVSEAELRAALAEFARGQAVLDLGLLTLTCLKDSGGIKDFVCLVPSQESAALMALEQAAVKTFDTFRRPLSEAEIANRNPEMLTARQRSHFAAYGYPFILDEYRPHFTLTAPVENAHDLADKLAITLAQQVGAARMVVDSLCLFQQNSAEERFRLVERFPFEKNPSRS